MEPAAPTPIGPAQRIALPGFAFVTTPPPERSRRRYLPGAVASLVAIFLLYGVMDENRSIRVDVAKRAQLDDVRIDPDYLPAALTQYPATVTGQTSGGKTVRCTIRSLHANESPSCVIPPTSEPVPQPQARVDAPVATPPPPSAGAPSTADGNEARETSRPRVTVPPVEITTPADDDPDGPNARQGRPTDDDEDGPNAGQGRPTDDDQDGPNAGQGRPADDDQDGPNARQGRPAEDSPLPGVNALTVLDTSDGVKKDDPKIGHDIRVEPDPEVRGHDDPAERDTAKP